MLQVWMFCSETHLSFYNKLEIVKLDFVGPLVDTAGDEAACMSIVDEDDTHTGKLTI